MNLERRAQIFATEKHKNQKRKYTGDPYIIHPAAVAAQVRNVLNHTEEQLAAAWLHDTVEDCGVTIAEITELFGSEVAYLVGWLTDVSLPSDGNRATRKAIDRRHTAQAPAAAQTIKLADLIDNSVSIIRHDEKFAKVYLREKALLLEVLTKGDARLLQQAKAIVVAALNKWITKQIKTL